MVHSVSGWMRGVHVKLWDPLKTRAIPDRLRGVFTTRRYTNTRLPLPLLVQKVRKKLPCLCYPVANTEKSHSLHKISLVKKSYTNVWNWMPATKLHLHHSENWAKITQMVLNKTTVKLWPQVIIQLLLLSLLVTGYVHIGQQPVSHLVWTVDAAIFDTVRFQLRLHSLRPEDEKCTVITQLSHFNTSIF